MEEKIMHLLITEDDMALAQGLQRALQAGDQTASAPEQDRSADSRCESAGRKRF